MARSAVPSEERIFSLVLALIASEHGLTKTELLSSVYGYSDRFRDGASRGALERQFERDKEMLRELGVPVEALDTAGEPGNNQNTRYRVSKQAFEVPPGLEFTERELMMLRLAALAWREGSLAVEARRATMKLESLSGGKHGHSLRVDPDFGTSEPAAPALLAATSDRSAVEFAYRIPARNDALRRRVVPLRLHRFERRWHLIAYDLERAAPRVFLLSRIEGAVSRLGPSEALPHDIDVDALVERTVAELHALQERQQIVARVREKSVADAELAPRAEVIEELGNWRVVRWGTVDYAETAVKLAGFGADVVVESPESVRNDVERLLRAVYEAHAPADGRTPTDKQTGGAYA